VITRPSPLLRRAVLAAALALPAMLGAQLRLEVSPFVGYMPGFDLESELTVSRDGSSAEGELRRDVDGGPAYGLRAEAGLSRAIAVYAQAAMGETGQRHDGFFSMGPVLSPVYADYEGYDVLLLSGGISVQPVGPLFRIHAGPALVRLGEDGEDAVTHRALQAGFAIAFDVAPRLQLTAGADEFVVMWDHDAIADGFTAEVAPSVTAESSGDHSYLPLIRLGVTFRP
jgi:hypothetical protein